MEISTKYFYMIFFIREIFSRRESGLEWNVPGEILCEAVYMYSHPTTYNINGTRWSRDPHCEFPTLSIKKQSYSIKYQTYERADHSWMTHR